MPIPTTCYDTSVLAGSGEEAAVSPNVGEFGDLNTKIKMQTTDQQRNVLRMLEKSLAKEMELEKKLSDCKNNEYELRMKLYSSEQDVVYMEEVIEDTYTKLLEAENASEVFKGMSKEMSGKLQILRFNLSGSFKREDVLKSELVGSMELLEAKESALYKLDSSNARLHDFLMAQTEGLKESLREAEEKMILLNTENSTLSEKVNSLEEQLNEYGIQTKDVDDTSAALINDLECLDDELKNELAKAESRAEEAESKCRTLEESEKELEKHLRDSDLQLKHAVASLEASKEKQKLLCSTVADTEAEVSELNKELKLCRGRLKEVEERKLRTAKDIGVHNKIMKKLVMQLASERERLHKQVSRYGPYS